MLLQRIVGCRQTCQSTSHDAQVPWRRSRRVDGIEAGCCQSSCRFVYYGDMRESHAPISTEQNSIEPNQQETQLLLALGKQREVWDSHSCPGLSKNGLVDMQWPNLMRQKQSQYDCEMNLAQCTCLCSKVSGKGNLSDAFPLSRG